MKTKINRRDHLKTLKFILLLALMPASLASAIPIPNLCGTGVNGNCVGLNPGPLEATWRLAVPYPTSPSEEPVPLPSTLIYSLTFVNTPIPEWLPNGPDTQWISPFVTNNLGGNYVYQITFDIPIGYDPATATISGWWSSDNEGIRVWLNNTPLAGFPLPGLVDFNVKTFFTITHGNAGAIFQPGPNTLYFHIRNRGQGGDDSLPTPTGLRVEFTGSSVLPLRLGNYPDTSLPLSWNTTIIPESPPNPPTRVYVSISTSFKGKLEVDPMTGVVRVTDAHPAGTYAVRLSVNGSGGVAFSNFTLTVTTPPQCNPIDPLSFKAKRDFAAGTNPRAVAIGDFNRDGIQDLAFALTDSHVSVLLGTGTGTGMFFLPAGTFAVNGTAQSVVVGDFNGDGIQDLATANPGTNKVSVLLGSTVALSTTVTFGLHTDYDVGTQPRSIAVGDFNGPFGRRDGRQDLVTANENSHDVSVLLGNDDGSFRAAINFDIGDGLFPYGVTVGDFNGQFGGGDGKDDIAITTRDPDNVVVLLNSSSSIILLAPTFSPIIPFGVGSDPNSVAVGDFNGDFRQDLVTANQSSDDASVLLHTQSGTPIFSPILPYFARTAPQSVAVGDFNRSGAQDLAVANGNNYVSVLLGDGNGSFSGPNTFGAGSSPSSVAVGDFDADGKQDLVVANYVSNNVSILLGKCCSGVPPVGTAVSRKDHGACGTFDIPLPQTYPFGTECRSGGSDGVYQIVVSFPSDVTYSGAVVKCGVARVVSVTGTNPVIINLASVADAQVIKVTLVGVDDGGVKCGNVEVKMGVLIGDTDGNGCVNSTDVSQTKFQSGHAVTGSNFRDDVTANCAINSSDVSWTKKTGRCVIDPCP